MLFTIYSPYGRLLGKHIQDYGYGSSSSTSRAPLTPCVTTDQYSIAHTKTVICVLKANEVDAVSIY